MDPLAFGVFDGFAPDELGDGMTANVYDAHIADAKRAEQLGYSYYFFIEHQNAAMACIASPNVYLAALARETTTLRFGPMVYQLPMHHPLLLAQDAAMVDQLSHGRLEFSIGYGTQAIEFDRMGIPYGERREMGLEAMEIILKSWTLDRITHDGNYWSLHDAIAKPRPYQLPHPPIWIGAHSPTSFDYAAENNFHVAQNLDVENLIGEKFAYFRDRWRSHGHMGPMPHQLLVRHVHVAETDQLAREEAERYMNEGLGGQRAYERAHNLRPEERDPAMLEIAKNYIESHDNYDYWIRQGLGLIGSAQTVARRVREQHELCGFDIFCTQHQIGSMPKAMARRSLDLFGTEVIPALHATL
ncbi:MAG: Bac luciferase protein [Chloroflexi bacterium]|nr:Bac luciferase protein [Chloroflexota bacterium]